MSETVSVLRVAASQINSTVGDFAGNAEKILTAAKRAQREGADILLTPEMSLVGYPAEDWLLRDDFCERASDALYELAGKLGREIRIPVLVGVVVLDKYVRRNALVVLSGGKIAGCYFKRHLPEYGVFDETRVFRPGKSPSLFTVRGVRVALAVCEDLWYADVAQESAVAGAQVLLVANASPFYRGKRAEREAKVTRHAAAAHLPMVYVNAVGGQDELVFDGASFVSDGAGVIHARLSSFAEDFRVFEVPVTGSKAAWKAPEAACEEGYSDLYGALVLATRDYVKKNGFSDVALGLSGGVDSALVASIAADALGAEHVHCLMMPTRFTADQSLSDAQKVASNLGVHYDIVPIEPMFESYLGGLRDAFAGRPWDITEENLQARIRGTLLMAFSNKFSRLVLATGNKSESAVGYSTLYGDTAGAFAPIRDVLKTDVWALCRARNAAAGREVIPESIITRAPSAELRENQTDEQTLPQYEMLDTVIRLYVQEGKNVEQIVCAGVPREVAQRVIRMIHRNEYKRRQCPVGPKVTPLAFGRDWRYAMTAKL